MNQLQHENSPYLLQHAHNPVDWYAWKPEAFAKAENEDKPILVSIGYSTCHWCHVMERESFEDQEVAEFMNEHFVCIKVDREERPDVDQIYMEACQVLTGGGGWPLNCFLTPDKRPFYAGLIFPADACP
ncbi:MAG: thioredoxin domain-containing protein [Saprospiraceae bacterium]